MEYITILEDKMNNKRIVFLKGFYKKVHNFREDYIVGYKKAARKSCSH